MIKREQEQYETLEKLKPLWEIFEELEPEILSRGTTPKYPTGLTGLDDLIWGLHKTQLLTVGASTGVGKTSFAIYLAMNLLNANAKVVYFTLEMTELAMCERMFSRYTKLDGDSLRRGVLKDRFLKEKDKFMSWAEDQNILVTNKYGRNFDDVVKVCKITKPDFVIIDYIQMISENDFKDKKAAIDHFLISISQLAKDMNFGIINVSQMNRLSADTTRPYKHHLMWSSVLEHHSHTILLLHDNIEKNEYNIYIDKQRHGRVGKVRVNYDGAISNFTDYKETPPLQEERPRAY